MSLPRPSAATSCLRLAACLVLFAAGAVGRAATFYVSESTGNDAWSGTKAEASGTDGPWKTLAKAAARKCEPGDQILLKRGDTWHEELHPQGSGTPAAPILIGAYGEGPRPVIDRVDDKQDRNGIYLYDQEGYSIVGLEFARCMTGIYAEFSKGCPTKKHLLVEDCYFHDALLYQHYEDYPKRKIGLGICLFSFETANKVVLTDITLRKCVFRRLASGVWTNSPDNFNKNASFIYNFANMTIEDCLFEEGYQWQLGLRGVAGGAVRRCVTHDVGRGFRSFNGVAGAMFFRCKDWVFEDSEWGFVDIGLGSGDGEAFDFEGNCDNMTMRDCLFHDTDGPGFLLCCYASDGNPNKGIVMENCVINGKSKRPIGLPRCAIVNTTDWTECTWKGCRFYLSPGEALMRVMDPEKDKRSTFENCFIKDLTQACAGERLPAEARASSAAAAQGAGLADDGKPDTAWKPEAGAEPWLELDFGQARAVNAFRLGEATGSSIQRYRIEYWDDGAKAWRRCFTGGAIGTDFVAPIVARKTTKARLVVEAVKEGVPAVTEFAAFDDDPGEPFSLPRGQQVPNRVGK